MFILEPSIQQRKPGMNNIWSWWLVSSIDDCLLLQQYLHVSYVRENIDICITNSLCRVAIIWGHFDIDMSFYS